MRALAAALPSAHTGAPVHHRVSHSACAGTWGTIQPGCTSSRWARGGAGGRAAALARAASHRRGAAAWLVGSCLVCPGSGNVFLRVFHLPAGGSSSAHPRRPGRLRAALHPARSPAWAGAAAAAAWSPLCQWRLRLIWQHSQTTLETCLHGECGRAGSAGLAWPRLQKQRLRAGPCQQMHHSSTGLGALSQPLPRPPSWGPSSALALQQDQDCGDHWAHLVRPREPVPPGGCRHECGEAQHEPRRPREPQGGAAVLRCGCVVRCGGCRLLSPAANLAPPAAAAAAKRRACGRHLCQWSGWGLHAGCSNGSGSINSMHGCPTTNLGAGGCGPGSRIQLAGPRQPCGEAL